MSTDELDVLLIEDNPGDARLIEEMFRNAEDLLERVDHGEPITGVQVHYEQYLSAGLERLSEVSVDAVLLDLRLPDSTGIDTLATLVDETEFVPIVVLTGLHDEQLGIEAIQRGAQDYLVKDEVTGDLLARSIHHAIERNRQERERTRRREQLEALNTLTRELMNAETAAEVSEYVVEAAEEMLGLPISAVALYDNQKGTLEPTAMTEAAAEGVRAAPLLDAADGAGWQAFAGNDVQRVSSQLGSGDADGTHQPTVTEVILFPLSRHGVFITGSTTPGGFEAPDLEFIETVTGNIEATLDRVARERQLHEREQTLEEQNHTLQRLNRINDIIRNIAKAIVQASTRQEIEAVVCEQLADVGLYELAWIGEHDAMAGEVRPRESAGNDKGYLDSITVRTDDSLEGNGPISRAVRTREPQVVNDILEDRSFEPWRRDALSRGYHASVAIPLTYDETLYSVLSIYAKQPDVFDELERAVLTELADTIAYAINAVESKKALVSNEVARLTFSVTDSNLKILELAREVGCELAVENLVPRSDGGIRAFFTTRGVPAADVLRFAPRLPTRNLTTVSEHDENGEQVCLFEADLTEWSLSATVLKHGGRPQTIQVGDGSATVVIELAAAAAVREFVDMFQSKYPDSELVAQRTHERPRQSPTELRASLIDTLTDRQFEALQTAYFGGYFREPRTQTANEVAGSMGISQPTFNSHLRAAERKICHKLFREGTLES